MPKKNQLFLFMNLLTLISIQRNLESWSLPNIFRRRGNLNQVCPIQVNPDSNDSRESLYKPKTEETPWPPNLNTSAYNHDYSNPPASQAHVQSLEPWKERLYKAIDNFLENKIEPIGLFETMKELRKDDATYQFLHPFRSIATAALHNNQLDLGEFVGNIWILLTNKRQGYSDQNFTPLDQEYLSKLMQQLFKIIIDWDIIDNPKYAYSNRQLKTYVLPGGKIKGDKLPSGIRSETNTKPDHVEEVTLPGGVKLQAKMFWQPRQDTSACKPDSSNLPFDEALESKLLEGLNYLPTTKGFSWKFKNETLEDIINWAHKTGVPVGYREHIRWLKNLLNAFSSNSAQDMKNVLMGLPFFGQTLNKILNQKLNETMDAFSGSMNSWRW